MLRAVSWRTRTRAARCVTIASGKQESKNAVLVGRSFVMKRKPSLTQSGVPESFLSKFGSEITAILSGFDRVRFRGTLRVLFQPNSMEAYLCACKVLIKHFKPFAEKLTNRVKEAAYRAAQAAGRPVRYLADPEISKEELACELARKDGIKKGLIGIFTAVEPCLSYSVRGDRQSREIHLVMERRKCTHIYHYYLHPEFGLCHVRVQTWFPFTVEACINGREWLARQMDRAQLKYQQHDNCFTQLSDAKRAQALMDQQLRTDWPRLLNGLLKKAHPLHEEIGQPLNQHYYWSASQTEYATDIIFRDINVLQRLYPQFLHHAIRTFRSEDVLRYLGYRCPSKFRGKVASTLKRRPEGIRVRHTADGNSLKIYDKAYEAKGSVLRVESTITNPEPFKVYRAAEGDPEQRLRWFRLRRGIADLWRRGEICRAANFRYVNALATVTGKTPLKEEAAEVCRAITVDRQPFRGLNPWSPDDAALLEAISRGEFMLSGLRNRDIRRLLYSTKASDEEQRRRAAQVTRKLTLLRAHGLLRKVSGTHRYLLTDKGRRIVTALLAARQADVDSLTKIAA
jgi:hypothetical protein